jgi:hypothetical protein
VRARQEPRALDARHDRRRRDAHPTVLLLARRRGREADHARCVCRALHPGKTSRTALSLSAGCWLARCWLARCWLPRCWLACCSRRDGTDRLHAAADDLHEAANGAHIVYLNGLILGIHRQPHMLMERIRKMRRCGVLGEFVSVQLHPVHRTVNIASDSGRVCRPLIVVERGRPMLRAVHMEQLAAGQRDFASFVRDGIIEYLDVNEENSCELAISEKDLNGPGGAAKTHMEIDPLTILGAVAGLIPYPHHNQSPRNTYQCAMGKQAMGVIANNYQDRIDTILYLLHYPQRPLVKTRTLDLIGFAKLPAGHNATVAVMVRATTHTMATSRTRARAAPCSRRSRAAAAR